MLPNQKTTFFIFGQKANGYLEKTQNYKVFYS
jgi:hypothetical protein